MGIHSKGQYGIEKGLFFSFPLRCTGEGKFEVVEDVELTEEDWKYLNITQNELLQERDVVKSMLQ